MFQLAKVTEIHRLSPYAIVYPKAAVTQPDLVRASLQAVPPTPKP